MDKRMKRLVRMLRKKGYTDRYIERDWSDQWAKRRWYDVEGAADNSILQIITANQYTRINLKDASSQRPFELMQYSSTEHPVFPKCGFKGRAETRETMDAIVSVIKRLGRFSGDEIASMFKLVATFSTEEI
jgi:hypothetical protein